MPFKLASKLLVSSPSSRFDSPPMPISAVASSVPATPKQAPGSAAGGNCTHAMVSQQAICSMLTAICQSLLDRSPQRSGLHLGTRHDCKHTRTMHEVRCGVVTPHSARQRHHTTKMQGGGRLPARAGTLAMLQVSYWSSGLKPPEGQRSIISACIGFSRAAAQKLVSMMKAQMNRTSI